MKKSILAILFSFLGSCVFAGTEAKNNEPAPTRADIANGTFERNTLDFWQAEAEGSRPVISYKYPRK